MLFIIKESRYSACHFENQQDDMLQQGSRTVASTNEITQLLYDCYASPECGTKIHSFSLLVAGGTSK
jgi:hypothetical protein